MIIRYRKKFLKMEELWGRNESSPAGKVDVSMKMRLINSPDKLPLAKKNPDKASLEVMIPNYLIDLSLDEEELYKKIHKSTRADIRKATEENQLKYHEFDDPTDQQIIEFSKIYNDFAKKKNISLCNTEMLLDIKKNNSLVLTHVTDQKNNILCGSMLVEDRNNQQLYGLYGVTTRLSNVSQKEKNLIGRANKFLQWKEIQSAKKRGMGWYNFGGEVFIEKDKGVNDFKKRFGTKNGYDLRIYESKSMVGKIFVYLVSLKWKKALNTNRDRNRNILAGITWMAFPILEAFLESHFLMDLLTNI